MIDPGVIVAVAIPTLAIAVAWGDMRRQVSNNRERQDERHAENKEKLDEIGDDVKRINGSVGRHEVRLDEHSRELNRLRVEEIAELEKRIAAAKPKRRTR